VSSSISKLTSIGSHPLSGPLVSIEGIDDTLISGAELEESGLIRLLCCKNGFYAFEGALHVMSSSSAIREYGLAKWNSHNLWRADYQGLADRSFFFAEDVFGSQFCLHNGAVMSFDPETGERELIASNVDEWAQRILDDYDLLTGHQLAHEWQVQHGAIPVGHRLIPKVPFVLGGGFVVENLFPLESAKAMRSRANLAVQIKTLPDGTEVEFKLDD
jgi:hypothetical protein